MLHSDIWNTHDSPNISVPIPDVLSMLRFFSDFSPTWKVHADICWRADNIGGKGLQGVTDLGDPRMMEIRWNLELDLLLFVLDGFLCLESASHFPTQKTFHIP